MTRVSVWFLFGTVATAYTACGETGVTNVAPVPCAEIQPAAGMVATTPSTTDMTTPPTMDMATPPTMDMGTPPTMDMAGAVMTPMGGMPTETMDGTAGTMDAIEPGAPEELPACPSGFECAVNMTAGIELKDADGNDLTTTPACNVPGGMPPFCGEGDDTTPCEAAGLVGAVCMRVSSGGFEVPGILICGQKCSP